MAPAPPGSLYQFERQGYFCVDGKASAPGAPVFNRTVTLKDAWAKPQRPQKNKPKAGAAVRFGSKKAGGLIPVQAFAELK